jgi:CheY-like chemotaxis protein
MTRRDDGPAANIGRILVVEDSASARRLLQDILLRLGAELPDLRIAGTILEAMTLVSQWRPQIVFVDVELRAAPVPTLGAPAAAPSPQDPKDGVELARLIRTRNPGVRIIVCSATDPSEPRVAKLVQELHLEYIVKPIVAARVADVLAREPPLRAHVEH